MIFLKKSTCFLYVFFLSKKSQKETFFDILDRKQSFLDLKSEVLTKSKKIDILQRGSPWFLSKNRPFSHIFVLRKKTKKETIFDILDSKECFLDHKRKLLKKSKKIDILKRG